MKSQMLEETKLKMRLKSSVIIAEYSQSIANIRLLKKQLSQAPIVNSIFNFGMALEGIEKNGN